MQCSEQSRNIVGYFRPSLDAMQSAKLVLFRLLLRQPEVAGQINTAMIITAALIEGATLFAVVVTLLAVF